MNLICAEKGIPFPIPPKCIPLYQDIARLHDGDYFLNGKLYDANGTEVPVLAAEAH
ncbi:hypothetical protein [Sinorhizobium meliloti]|uniref:hypothetical protein n=1 Tax=Rhizobium meliloti TaxID=382 RepID=UPI0013E29DDB|nr:hypothetical protein [Sinorhizobium meliloti]